MALLKRNRNGSETAEMSFVDHLEALRGHLFRSVIAIIIGGIIVAVYNDFFVRDVLMGPTHGNFPTYAWLCRVGRGMGMRDALCMTIMDVKMQSTSVSGQFSMYFTVLVIGGIIIAFPYIFWEFWRFIRPALTKKELSKTRGVIFWVSILFFSGVFFGYFVIAPYTVNFFANFQLDKNIENQWTIESYIDTLIPLILGTGLAFQLPLVMFFLSKIGLVTPTFLRSARKYAIVIILVVAGVITPPDVISQIIVTLPLILLYEVSIWLSARVAKEDAKAEALEWS
jgi:sec-independent protein translocase protein TatC